MNKSRKRSMFLTLLLSYVVILLIPLSIGFVSYYQSSTKIRSQMEKNIMTITEQAQQALQSTISSVDEVSKSMSANLKINRFLEVEKPFNGQDILDIADIITDITRYSNFNTAIEMIFVYYKTSDQIIMSSANYDSRTFFNQFMKYNDLNYEQWKKDLDSLNQGRFLAAYEPAMLSPYTKVIPYLQSIPNYLRGKSMGTICILIDADRLNTLLGDILGPSETFIMKEQDLVVDSFSSIGYQFDILNVDYFVGQGLRYEKINNRDVIISYSSSTKNEWRIVSILPLEVYGNELYFTQNILWFIMLVGAIAGILIAYVFARINYKPILNLVNLIRGINTSLPSAVGNEIKYIENATLHAFKENIQIKQQIEERKPLLINITLRYLLRGFGLENIDTTEILHSFDIIFRFAQNKVIVIKACESSEITVQTRIRNSMIAELKLAELVKEILPKEFSYYIVKVEWDEIALIINSDIADDKLNRIITEVVLTYKRLLANESEMFINIGIGSVYQEFTGISKSYEEAIIALQYCIYSGLNSVCEYNEIRSYSQKYYYPLDMESRLMNSIRSGDILNTKTILNRLFEENFKKRKLSLDMTKCLYFDIMSTVIKLINELSESDSEVSSIVNNQLNVLVSCKTADDLYRVTENLVSAVCLRIENNKKSHNAKLKMIICEYIEANYSNSDLSISMIADRFGISPNYLSFYFREQTAENISDYISRRRIDEAKRLLRDEKISISDVSEKVGYLSVSVFVRAFKRIEGVTPGKYRNSQLKLPE